MKDELEELVDAAHDLFGDYSIYEVMDLDRPAAIGRMVEMYGGSVDLGKMERYFAILDRIREWREPVLSKAPPRSFRLRKQNFKIFRAQTCGRLPRKKSGCLSEPILEMINPRL